MLAEANAEATVVDADDETQRAVCVTCVQYKLGAGDRTYSPARHVAEREHARIGCRSQRQNGEQGNQCTEAGRHAYVIDADNVASTDHRPEWTDVRSACCRNRYSEGRPADASSPSSLASAAPMRAASFGLAATIARPATSQMPTTRGKRL